jgi:hypothetical protein
METGTLVSLIFILASSSFTSRSLMEVEAEVLQLSQLQGFNLDCAIVDIVKSQLKEGMDTR